MKIARAPHSWSVTPRRAVAIQQKLAARVRVVAPSDDLRLIAGVDAAFSRDVVLSHSLFLSLSPVRALTA